MLSLLRSTITISRDDGTGEYSEEGRWVKAPLQIINDVKASIQPVKNGEAKSILPEGVRAMDAVFVYTKEVIKTVDQYGFTLADRTDIDGQTYIANNIANWFRHSLRPDHYKVIFIREEKLRNGGQ